MPQHVSSGQASSHCRAGGPLVGFLGGAAERLLGVDGAPLCHAWTDCVFVPAQVRTPSGIGGTALVHLCASVMGAVLPGRSFVKVGSMVFLCHDINDIFLEAAKMARYAQQKHAPNVLFVVFMLSWFASRIYYFPAYVIRSVIYEPIEVRHKVLGACAAM